MMRRLSLSLLVLVLTLLVACHASGQDVAQDRTATDVTPEDSVPQAAPGGEVIAESAAAENTATEQVVPDNVIEKYPWSKLVDTSVPHVPLEARFKPPTGFERVQLSDTSYGAFLRGLPVRTDRTYVLSHNGSRLNSPSAAVVLLDVGKRDLQQCADAAIRLHAEYLWSQKRAQEAAYHFTSGDLSTWRAWQRGERFRIKGSKVERVQGQARPNTHGEYRKWLDLVFMYAGSRSIARDTVGVKIDDVQPGDMYAIGGSPGHVVVVLDVAEAKDGRKVALLGQSYMPAQDFHVLRATGPRTLDGVWFLLPDTNFRELKTPSWAPFPAENVRRFE